MGTTPAAHSCRTCAAGVRPSRLRLHSQVQRQVFDRMVRVDRWYHDCPVCGCAAVLCTVASWELPQAAPHPIPPQDPTDWPTEALTAVVVAPEEVPMPDPDRPDPYATPWPTPPKTGAGRAVTGPRSSVAIPPLSAEERAEQEARRPGRDVMEQVLHGLRAHQWPTTDPGEGVRP